MVSKTNRKFTINKSRRSDSDKKSIKNDKLKKNKGNNNNRMRGYDYQRLNQEPSNSSMDDDQPLTRKLRELKKLVQEAKIKTPVIKRNKTPRNRFFDEASKLGYLQRPWEDEEKLLFRISKDTATAVGGELLKAKFGAAGRSISEIAEDYKLLDEKERLKKMQKMAYREKLKRLREKEKAFKKRKRKLEGTGLQESDSDNNDNELLDDPAPDISDYGNSEDGDECKKIKPTSKDSMATNDIVLSSRLRKREKLKLKRLDKQQEKAENKIMNAKDVIRFGERVDEPPKFSGNYQPNSKMGKKKLLLTNLFDGN